MDQLVTIPLFKRSAFDEEAVIPVDEHRASAPDFFQQHAGLEFLALEQALAAAAG